MGLWCCTGRFANIARLNLRRPPGDGEERFPKNAVKNREYSGLAWGGSEGSKANVAARLVVPVWQSPPSLRRTPSKPFDPVGTRPVRFGTSRTLQTIRDSNSGLRTWRQLRKRPQQQLGRH